MLTEILNFVQNEVRLSLNFELKVYFLPSTLLSYGRPVFRFKILEWDRAEKPKSCKSLESRPNSEPHSGLGLHNA